MARFAATSLLAVFACTLGGCIDTSNDSTILTYPTLLTIDPALFRGSLTCGAPGLARYVVTLFDVSTIGFPAVPSSGATRCSSVTSFGDSRLIASHYYIGDIDGYDRDDIQPEALGHRQMVDAATGEPVAPRWKTTCGELQGPGPDPDGGDAAGLADAGDDAENLPDALPPYNPLRSPTPVIGTDEVILRGCLALSETDRGSAKGDESSATKAPQNSAERAR